MSLQSMVENFCDEYGVDSSRISIDYGELDKNTLGLCSFMRLGSECHSLITISRRLKAYPLYTKATVWHEFCHAEVWVRDGYSDGHSTAFGKRLFRKPFLWLIDVWTSKLAWIYIRET